MVKPNDTPGDSQKPRPMSLTELLFGTAFANAAQQPPQSPAPVGETLHAEPKDDPAFMRHCYDVIATARRELAAMVACSCPRCRLAFYPTKIQEFAESETAAAAHTGDVSKLQAVLDLIEKLKRQK